MKQIPARLALSQLMINRKRTIITVVGILLSVAMMTAVFGFAVSGIETMRRLVGDAEIASYRSVLVSFAAVLGTIIMAASVVVISNAFRISASERMRQFGILKSVGATKRQILQTVMFEAAFLSAIAIPAGLIVGLLIQWLGSSIGDTLLAPMNKLVKEGLSVHMRFEFSWPVLLLSVTVSLLTVLLSAWLPARKAASVPAIEAIRMTQEITIRKGKLRTSRLVRALFGFEGTLAAKAIKRSRRSYRAMVAALSISIILFLTCGSLDTQLTMAMNQAYANVDANVLTTYSSLNSRSDFYHVPLAYDEAEEITGALRAYPETRVYGAGVDYGYAVDAQTAGLTDKMVKTLEPDQTTVSAVLVTLDREHYAALCESAGVEPGSSILVNTARKTIGNKDSEFQPLRFSGQTLTLTKDGEAVAVTLDAQLTGTQIPQEVFYAADGEDIIIVVPDGVATVYCWFGNSVDVSGFIGYAESTLASYFPVPEGSDAYAYSVLDVTSVTDMTRSLTKLITIFLYGFVGMLTIIGLTSVISAISANVRLRAREFAVLQSVGMTQGGIRRMLALESVMSALKALLWGIPIGSAAMYLSFVSLTIRNDFQFVYPWGMLLEAAAGVFIVTLIVTQYAAAKLRSGSIMDAIRMGEGL